jgi:hypothetical protein
MQSSRQKKMPVIPVNKVVDDKSIIGKRGLRKRRRTDQGCQIYLDTTYQNRKIYTKWS